MPAFRAVEEHLGGLADLVDARAARLAEQDALARIWDRDHTLWQPDPTEVADRLGWLDCPARFSAEVGRLASFAERATASGFTHAVVVGMGGSSLFPEVLSYVFGSAPGWVEVLVIDSTVPAAVRRLEREVPLDSALFLIASKSGTTIETRSLLDHLWALYQRERDPAHAGRHFAAITDPGTELAELAREREFFDLFENPTDIGGRYSALSYFGLVPGALLGADLGALLAGGQDAAAASRAAEDNPAFRLAAVMAAAHDAGRNKLTLLLPDEIAPFGDWIEQLVAESTGKHGVGILPVVGDPPTGPERYGDDRLFVATGDVGDLGPLVDAGHPVVHLSFEEPTDLGAHVFTWELATALAGAALGVNPFDQPDVAAAKSATDRVLREGLPEVETIDPADLLAKVGPGDYVAITAFVDPAGAVVDQLEEVRGRLRDRLGVAVTLGIGPRYLHSTGQLHKGGPPQGVFLQVVGTDAEELPIAGRGYGFSTLKHAQAAGDLQALRDAGLRVGRVELTDLLAG